MGKHESVSPPGHRGDHPALTRISGKRVAPVTARLRPYIIVGQISPDRGCFGPRSSVCSRRGTDVTGEAIHRAAAVIADRNPAESEGCQM